MVVSEAEPEWFYFSLNEDWEHLRLRHIQTGESSNVL